MKYIVTEGTSEIRRFKRFEEAVGFVQELQHGKNHTLNVSILEVFAEHEWRCSRDYYFKERKF